MKKWFCALGMMLALLMSVALADGVKVTFAEKNGQINGGYDYTLKLNVSPASDKDLTVSLTCDGLDGAYSVVIPAGQKSTMLTVPTQVVEERGKVVFELQSGDGYTGAGKHTLTIQRLATRLSSAPRKWRRRSRNTPPSANPSKKTQWHPACRRSSSGARVCKARAIIGASCAGWAYRHTTTARGWASSPGASTLPAIPSAGRKIWTISPKVSPTRLKK